ncbi:Nucleolar protein 13 [Kalmusia sp. IMI 367209]|nr:Nucleolar protein 13 [Kalmusia sp. IMI 367209]
MSSFPEPIALPKPPKREKKDKKDKKEKKRKAAEVAEDIESAEEATEISKKRKRDALPEEIEIDVSLPEPASKKAARKAKKVKLQPASANSTTDVENGTTATAQDKAEQATKRSEFSVWIGNLPWSATKDSLRTFLTENAEIKNEDITRIHMPAPKAPPRPNWTDAKPQNKGFAYVDFSTQLAMYSAIALTETRMDRRPLLIKNSKNFEGRPDKPKEPEEDLAKGKGKETKAPSRKIFVGNLGFETSKEDMEAHFKPCGVIENIHMATFEDTGKCKGFAWVTFEDVDAAAAAVKGYVYKHETKAEKKTTADDEADHDDDDEAQEKSKKRKYKLNKLLGRDLRCEFAEDSTTRYNKRFGKEKNEDGPAAGEDGGFQRPQRGRKPFTPRNNFREHKVDPRTIAPGAAHTNAPRASAAIVESKGKKITFD